MAQSGNRPPRGGQSKRGGGQSRSSNGNRSPRGERTVPTPVSGSRAESAAERARERLAQQGASGQKRQTASQRARAGGASTQRARAGGAASRRGSSRGAPRHSTAKTAGIFGAALVVLAVLVIVLVSVVGKSSTGGGQYFGTQVATAAVVSAVTATPASAFAQAGSTITSTGPFTSGIYTLKGLPKLTQGGKPLIVYVGSEWCPYCAATRWPLAIALARFGTFTGLHMTKSSLSDVYPGTPSLSFYGSTYTSPYIAFSPIEQCTDIPSTSTSQAVRACNGYEPLTTWTPAVSKLFLKYDYPPYVPSGGLAPGGIPFVDFANQFHEDGAFISPTILQGYTHARVAQSLSNPAASPAQPILVGANFYSAMICKLTNNKPGSICQMPAVKQAGAQLKL